MKFKPDVQLLAQKIADTGMNIYEFSYKSGINMKTLDKFMYGELEKITIDEYLQVSRCLNINFLEFLFPGLTYDAIIKILYELG